MPKPESAADPKLENLDETTIRNLFSHAGDVVVKRMYEEPAPERLNPLLVYCEGMIDSGMLNDFLFEHARHLLLRPDASRVPEQPIEQLRMKKIEGNGAGETMIRSVLSGQLVLFFQEPRSIYVANLSKPPARKPDESSTEISIKGPRDGFTEEADVNVALIRKRLKSPELAVEYFYLGTRSRTKTALLYLRDVVNPQFIREARSRIEGIRIDGILSSQQLEEGLSDSSYSLIPLIEYIGRPDYAAASLLSGRFVIVVDGSPMVLLAPANLSSLLKSPEDLHLPFYFVSLERILRLLGFMVAVFLPGFWVSVSSFNLDQIPFPLVASIVVARLGLPLSGPIDLFLMIGLFELFREAGMRLPKAVGQTVAVVGGLIVGEAAIDAGFTGPTTLVISAVTAVASFTLVNQGLTGSVTVLRFFVLSMSCLFGMFGFFISLYLIFVYLSSITSFGVPFMSPISPIRFRDVLYAVISLPVKWYKKRPQMYEPLDRSRQKENS
ncbi:spore germination protein [Cohnella caldifontis]|uniref:spore germination protein n=1 Tax=Cohnella caldifontis TaxID=3027471 RepID=UPI0023EC9AE2|nr:spore germination protein [Cohnella sp. YIM B05605]